MSNSPPFPGSDLADWANKMYQFLVRQTDVDARVEPKAVMLLHRVSNRLFRATTPGTLIYDPIKDVPLVSRQGMWHPVDAGSYVDLSYMRAFNLDGEVLASGENDIPFNTTHYLPAWAALADVGELTLQQGKYYIEGSVTVARDDTGDIEALLYMAEISDLTTPQGNVMSSPIYQPDGTGNSNVEVPFSGMLDVPPNGATYAAVLRCSAGNVRLGYAHNLSGLGNTYFRMKVSLVGVPEQ
jgi:hypothetical protein